MKRILLLMIILCLIVIACAKEKKEDDNNNLKGTITISGAWALYPMTVKWAEEYNLVYPSVHVDISAGGAGKGMADVISNVVDIGMVSREIFPVEKEKGVWWVSVAKDAVVPTCNEHNPYLDDLLKRGITQQEFRNIWITGTILFWGDLIDMDDTHPITIYTRSDACGAAQTWAQYLDANQEDMEGIGVYGDPGLAEAVRKDVYGIGFNNINYAYDPNTKNPVSGIKILPLDINGNNTIDPGEDVYISINTIVKAISDGAYPSPPARNLFFVCHGKPEKMLLKQFVHWVLTDGQGFVSETGYIPVDKNEIDKGLEDLK